MPKNVTEGQLRNRAAAQGKAKRAPIRLWVKARFLGFRRAKNTQTCSAALLKIEGVNDHQDAQYYFGKRVAHIYKAHNSVRGSRFRVSWGRIARAHGQNGVVIARFRKNLNARAMGSNLRVFLYPQRFNN
eukprot:NODE_6190_length_525_cov_53.052521_g5426_i0.p1 GENE.NODE_6190_length_525_cov_53.052521_g5426_i0~~NODE_6190_length_525_cov_53.052521_g5426_i0.p1  ORF type:complete len:142 (+),score=3.16 NODE_6190_length_525_cov_53.052521_g5426_i0:39-428(+)